MFRTRLFTTLFLVLAFALSGACAGAQAYTSIVIFGDSLCDTGNDALLSASMYTVNAQVPGPATGYNNGRFTDGTDTLPAAHAYYGVWIEQLAAMFPAKPVINYSLNPAGAGLNYAYGFATTGTGTTNFTYGPGNVLSFTVNNMATQVASYLATNPVITNKTLFVVWGGANDLIAAVTAQDVQNAAMRDAALVQTLINAGATDFIIPNLPPLGLVPRFNGSPATSVPATTAAAGFDQALAAYLGAIPAANPGKTLHLYPLDTYTLFSTIVAAPSLRGFSNVTAMSQGNTTVNPDTYLFWDNLHPTTYGHNQLANAAFTLLGTPISTTTAVSASNLQPNPGQNFTLTAQVVAGSGIPSGTVSFLEGSTVLGTAYVTGNTASGTATLITSYPSAGKHTITASFAGVNGYSGSAAATSVAVTVAPPALTPTLSPTSLTITAGTYAQDTVTLTPQGGYSGSATVACGTLPAHFTCTVATPTLTLTGNNAAVSTNVTIGTIATASLDRPAHLPGRERRELLLACGLLPGFGLLTLGALRCKRTSLPRAMWMGTFVLLSALASLGLSGCSSSAPSSPSPIAAPGSYMVPIVVTSNGTAATLNLAVTVQ